MTQDQREEIIRMAREAGLIRQRGNLDIVKHSITQIERFAALVAAHEREKQVEQEPVCCVCGSKENLHYEGFWYGYRCGSEGCICL